MGERKRPKQVGLMLTQEEFDILKETADNERMAVGTYIRNRLFAEGKELIRKEKKENVD